MIKSKEESDEKAVQLEGKFWLMIVLLIFFLFALAFVILFGIWQNIVPLYYLLAPK